MVEYRKSLWVALTNPLALVLTCVIVIFLGNVFPKFKQPRFWITGKAATPITLSALIFLVTVSVFHWRKHRKKYKKLTKEALLAILSTGVINLLLCGFCIFLLQDARVWQKMPVDGRIYGNILKTMVSAVIGFSTAGFTSDLIWQLFWSPRL